VSELAKIDGGPMVPLTPRTAKELTARPLLAVPPELRAAVFQAWAVYRHLAGFDTPAAVAFAVSVWVNAHGVAPAKVAESLAEITHPRHMRAVKFASDFTATLAELLTPPETPAEWAARICRTTTTQESR
jgi:hypothetical protein